MLKANEVFFDYGCASRGAGKHYVRVCYRLIIVLADSATLMEIRCWFRDELVSTTVQIRKIRMKVTRGMKMIRRVSSEVEDTCNYSIYN